MGAVKDGKEMIFLKENNCHLHVAIFTWLKSHRVAMPGTPAAGGWGGSNRTLGIVMEGFTDQEVVVPTSLFLRTIMSAPAVCRPRVRVFVPRPSADRVCV